MGFGDRFTPFPNVAPMNPYIGGALTMPGYRPPATGASGQGGAGAGGDLFDAEGLPTRLPTNPQEALQFQFAASNWARRKNESMLENAQATLRYGLGMVNRFGPYSAATMMNPLLGQQAQAYMNMQYDQPDYSYFMRTGQQQTPQTIANFSGQSLPMGDWPVQMRWPQGALEGLVPGAGQAAPVQALVAGGDNMVRSGFMHFYGPEAEIPWNAYFAPNAAGGPGDLFSDYEEEEESEPWTPGSLF